MNSQLLGQLASQHVTEVRQDASRRTAAAAAAQTTERRESIRQRAGWTLIHAGLKLTGPPAQRGTGDPHPASL